MPATVTITQPSDREVRIVRQFNAPRRLVFDAHVKPELIRRWLLGPPGMTMPVCEFDARIGGKYRYVWEQRNGNRMGMTGTIHEIEPPSRIVSDEIFDEDWTGGPAHTELVFTEAGGKTTLTITILYSSKAARDGAVATGMTTGLEAGYGLLDDLLATLPG